MSDFFTDDDYFTGPPLTDEIVAHATATLGVSLPEAYLALLRERNGGVPKRQCFPTPFATSWAPDHVQVDAIRGLGGNWGIDATSGLGSADLITEWGYPPVGLVICSMPSGGHDTIMLDYATRPNADPRVVYIDEDRVPRELAPSFAEFIEGLRSCDEFEVPA